MLSVIGLPMSALAVPAAVHHEAASRTGRKLGSTGTPFRSKTVATNLAVEGGIFLGFLSVHAFVRHLNDRLSVLREWKREDSRPAWQPAVLISHNQRRECYACRSSKDQTPSRTLKQCDMNY
jgi:hypothetical protein